MYLHAYSHSYCSLRLLYSKFTIEHSRKAMQMTVHNEGQNAFERQYFIWKIVNKQLRNVNKFLEIEEICRFSNAICLFQH